MEAFLKLTIALYWGEFSITYRLQTKIPYENGKFTIGEHKSSCILHIILVMYVILCSSAWYVLLFWFTLIFTNLLHLTRKIIGFELRIAITPGAPALIGSFHLFVCFIMSWFFLFVFHDVSRFNLNLATWFELEYAPSKYYLLILLLGDWIFLSP